MAIDERMQAAVDGLRQVKARAPALDYGRIDRAIALIHEQAGELARLRVERAGKTCAPSVDCPWLADE